MKPIVVATDLSPISEPALLKGLSLARRFGVDVVLVHAWEPVAIAVLDAALLSTPERVAQITRDAQRALDDIIERYRPEHERISSRVVEGKPAAEVARIARELDAELVVVGTSAPTGLRRLLGSVADEIVRAAPCPVLVVRADLGVAR